MISARLGASRRCSRMVLTLLEFCGGEVKRRDERRQEGL